jgi:DNA-binding SARP family transcriptional activator/tetratricopeptide (TPR) repeat protein
MGAAGLISSAFRLVMMPMGRQQIICPTVQGCIVLCRVLGPLEVWTGDEWTGVGAAKLRVLLAVLVLRRGQVVAAAELADELWGDDPPPAARKLVSGYVLRARRLIGDPGGRVLVTRAPGYLLAVEQADVDVPRFEELAAAGRRALDGADGSRAAELLAGALALWRGPALADVPPGPLVAAAAGRLEELRLGAVELRAEAGIQCGRAAELVAELRQLTASYPLRERFWHQLMRVLAQSGRPAEALDAYGQARAVLAAELGADPGPGLQELHRRLLAGDLPAADPQAGHLPAADPRAGDLPAAASPQAGESGRGAAAAAPTVLRQLPGTAAQFSGRAAELAVVTGLLGAPAGKLPGTVLISAIDGMPGVGKTALAVHVGHQVASRFPDRQLFVDLHGHAPGRPPADPGDVLAALLAADGVDSRYLPPGVDDRAGMWRDRLAGHRVLLILDNAASSAQVAPLLPGSAGCLVLVTSRRFLGDLPAGVSELLLGVLRPDEAAAMFTGLAPRAAGEPDRVAELVELCGCLPLAITLLAALFTRHRAWDLADLISETRARLLTATAENRTVAAAFELSYQDLDAARQRFFRLLGLHPGEDIDAYAAAALADLPLAEAGGYLDGLHGDRLLEEPVPRRYRMHDLIRQYARSLAAAEDAGERDRATARLLDYYQHTAEAADAVPARSRTPTADPAPAPPAAPRLPSRDLAQAWMATERANLAACVDLAIARGSHARVTGLISAMAGHLRAAGALSQAIALHTVAAAAAQQLGDRLGYARALLNLGEARRLTGDYPAATSVLEQARDIYRGSADRLGEANALLHLGDVRRLTDDYPGATSMLEQALAMIRGTGDRLGEANGLLCLGMVRRLTGDFPDAARLLDLARGIYQEIGDSPGEVKALRDLGAVQLETDDYAGGTLLLEQALGLARAAGDRPGAANVLFYLGIARRWTGSFPDAARLLEQALEINQDIGDRLGQANALLYLGMVGLLTGDFPDAARLLEQGLEINQDIGDRLGQAHALLYLGMVRQRTGDYPDAGRLLQKALDTYRDIGHRSGEAEALNETGMLRLAQGDTQQARASYLRALELTRAIGGKLEEARALEGIGKCAATPPAAGPPHEALRQALEIYRRIGAAEATRLAAELDQWQPTAG